MSLFVIGRDTHFVRDLVCTADLIAIIVTAVSMFIYWSWALKYLGRNS